MVKECACNAGAAGDVSSISGSGRSPGGGHGNPLQYSCLENPMDRGAWWATRVGHRLKQLSMHTLIQPTEGLNKRLKRELRWRKLESSRFGG